MPGFTEQPAQPARHISPGKEAMTSTASPVSARAAAWPLLALGVPLALLGWAYWTTFLELSRIWALSSSYSHGYLVPFFALFLLWHRRGLLEPDRLRPNLFGLPLLAGALAMRLVGTWYYFSWLDPLSLIPAAAGVFLLVGGWRGLRWGWPASVFQFFMIPLPFSLQALLSDPLQRLATICSTFLMQMLGLPAVSEGNTILVNDASIGVVEACSGLRMLMVFFALASAVALIIQRSWAEKVILLASAIPIALLVNIIRITATGVLHEFVNSETANAFFHDVAGWFMMPMALLLLWAEYKLLVNLLVPSSAGSAPRPVAAPPARPKVAAPSARPGQSRPIVPPTPRSSARRLAGNRSQAAPAPDSSGPEEDPTVSI
jgi:exosortase